MIKSMTGFGRSEIASGNRKIMVEMKSVNHRYLDVNIKMPKKLNFFESAIRSELKNYISRGKVDLFITYEDFSENTSNVRYNKELAAEYLGYLKQMASDFDLAKAQYESKNMLDAELLDGLIKERIVLQYGEKIEDIITEEDVEKKLQALKAEQNGNIFYQKAMKEYGSEEAIKIALKNRLIYNFVKDDLMNQFLSVLRIDEDKLYFRAEEFAEQYDIDRLDNKEREDYLETVFMQYRDSLTNELFDLYFQVWLNEQFRNSDIKYVSDIEPLSTCKRIQLRGDSVLIDQEEDTLRNITFTEAQEVYGNFLYIPNEMEQYDSIEILGYHNVREQIKVLRIEYIDEKQKMPISISLIVSPDLEMGEEKVISENSGVNIVEYNIAQIGVKYSICSSLEVETIEEVLDRIIPYVLQ